MNLARADGFLLCWELMGTEEETEPRGSQWRQGKEWILSLSSVMTALGDFALHDTGNADKERCLYH